MPKAKPAYIFVLALLAAWMNAGCSRNSTANANNPEKPVVVEETSDASLVTVAHPEQFPLVRVEARSLRPELKVNGVVAPDVNRTKPVNSLTAGRVTSIHAQLGMDVKKAQVLLTLHSPEVGAAVSDLKKFQADEVLARRALERSQLLYSKGAIAQKDLEAAQDAYQRAKADLDNAQDRLRLLGADLRHPSPVIELRAPVSGTIIEQNITSGAAVKSLDNSPNLFTIADLSRLWVLCDLYEDLLPLVNVGDIATIRLNAYPDRAFQGKVGNISRVLDPTTRTAKARIELDNPEKIMRPGMFVTAWFQSRSVKETPVVPTSAIIRLHDQDWVFRPEGANRFRKVNVRLGQTLADKTQEVRAGLQVGDHVVANPLQLSSASEAR